jgi:hypothetical protein
LGAFQFVFMHFGIKDAHSVFAFSTIFRDLCQTILH